MDSLRMQSRRMLPQLSAVSGSSYLYAGPDTLHETHSTHVRHTCKALVKPS